MKENEHILVCLMEECSEVTKDVCKALRFGLDDSDPNMQGKTNRLKIATEWAEVIAIGEMLIARGVMPDFRTDEFIRAKKDKVSKYIGYAKLAGTIVE